MYTNFDISAYQGRIKHNITFYHINIFFMFTNAIINIIKKNILIIITKLKPKDQSMKSNLLYNTLHNNYYHVLTCQALTELIFSISQKYMFLTSGAIKRGLNLQF